MIMERIQKAEAGFRSLMDSLDTALGCGTHENVI
jgi:hypothetical protein